MLIHGLYKLYGVVWSTPKSQGPTSGEFDVKTQSSVGCNDGYSSTTNHARYGPAGSTNFTAAYRERAYRDDSA
jgi:hypothetical protein